MHHAIAYLLLFNNAPATRGRNLWPGPGPTAAWPFGDGFFETLIFTAGRLGLAADHHARMQPRRRLRSTSALPAPLATPEALAKPPSPTSPPPTACAAARLRLQLWRAGGGRYSPPTEAAEWLATAEPFAPDESPVALADFARETHSMYSPLSFCKGPQAWLYVRAAHERQQRGLDEIILCDAAGQVAEAGAAAIFWVKDDVLFTPALETGCVAGVRRAQVLRAARTAGVECREGLFMPEELVAADAVFTANVAAVRKLMQVGNILFAPLSQPPIASRIFEALR